MRPALLAAIVPGRGMLLGSNFDAPLDIALDLALDTPALDYNSRTQTGQAITTEGGTPITTEGGSIIVTES